MKNRFLMVCTLPPPVHGSAIVSQYIRDSKLINNEFDMDFVNLSTSRKMEEIGKASSIFLFKKLGRFVSAYISCFWLLLTNKYDLCYCAITCHGKGFLKDAPFVLLCKLFRRKVVIHQHNKGMSNDVDRNPYKWQIPLVYRNTKVILLSWLLYPDIEKVVKKEQILICPNGIPEIFHKEPLLERNKELPRLLFLSNLIESKGVYVLLDACKLLKDKGYQFFCDFVGGETKEITRDVFENEVRKRGIEGMIAYLGPKYGDEKDDVYKNADIFVFPTFNETFGLVNLEAMQYKLPIVSTNEGGIPDVVKDGENGFICKRKDVNSLVEALEKLIANPALCRQMGENGYLRYKKEYTLNAFEQKFVDAMKSAFL